MAASTFRDMTVYKKSFALAMEIFEISKTFPAEERYALIGQIRRSSRAVCANNAEGFRKRQYPAHFVAKVSDADAENTETQVWLDFSLKCRYIDQLQWQTLTQKSEEVGRLIHHMILHPEKY